MLSPRDEATQKARTWLDQQPVYLDTETTGIDRSSEIIEISILGEDGTILLDTLVKPSGGKIPYEATRIHGITAEMVKESPAWPEVYPRVQAILAGRAVGIYNADFDLRMLQQTSAKHMLPWGRQLGFSPFCIMLLYAQYKGEWNSARGGYRWHSLENAGAQAHIKLPNAHRAIADCKLTRALLHYMAGAIED